MRRGSWRTAVYAAIGEVLPGVSEERRKTIALRRNRITQGALG